MENLNYDEAVARIEKILHELETQDAISLEEYKQKAAEAKHLMDYCLGQIKTLETELTKE